MKKIISLGLAICSALITINFCTVQANAAWKKDSKGWKYDFEYGNTIAEGKKYNIDGKWYYFDEQGYMKTGWCKNANAEWYYAYSDGSLATDTVLYGYTFAKGGTMLDGITPKEVDYYRNLMYKQTSYNTTKEKEIDSHVETHVNYFGSVFNSIIVFDLYSPDFNEYFSVVIDRDSEKVYSTTNGGFYLEWSNGKYKAITS